ncbi:MAG: radical SAM protein [Spirochaetaceae bacterium]|jgi:nitrogen fixation protein NifB|nr:radical SAM protein [Spirochaetaceae bacterium]
MGFDDHPCFNAALRRGTGRIHLPVAEKCNVQCKFCNRKYDCVNESRPGVTGAVLSPFQALDYLDAALRRIGNISVVGIAGPGDPLACGEASLTTLEMVRERYPDKLLCLATNGLALAVYAERLAALGVSHVTVTCNAVDPAIGAKIYDWVRHGPRIRRGVEGAALLLEQQIEGVKRLKSLGLTVKINTVIIPGVNDAHAVKVAETMAGLGADIQNCVPLAPVEGTAFENAAPPAPEDMAALRLEAGKSLRQMTHCGRCRADAAGLIGERNRADLEELLREAGTARPAAERPYLAAASIEGLFVNRHLGEASSFWVFALENGKPVLKEERPAPPTGTGAARWEALADRLGDCFAILFSACGESPRRVLERRGFELVAGEGLISDIAGYLFTGKKVPGIYRVKTGHCGAGEGCSGTGCGCGA